MPFFVRVRLQSMSENSRIFVGRGFSHDVSTINAVRLQPLKYSFWGCDTRRPLPWIQLKTTWRSLSGHEVAIKERLRFQRKLPMRSGLVKHMIAVQPQK